MTPKGARVIALVSVLLLIELAWFQLARRGVDADLQSEAQRHGQRVAELRQKNRDLQAAIREDRTEAQAIAVGPAADTFAAVLEGLPVDRTARNRELLSLVRSGLIGQVTYAAPSQFKVSTKVNKLGEVLSLTPGETSTLLAAAEAVSTTLLAGAQVRIGENDQLHIEMKDSPQAKAELARMRDTFRQVLGGDGYAIYEAMGFRSALENSLNNLGLSAYSMTVTKTVDEATQTPRYRFVKEGGDAPTAPTGDTVVRAPVAPGTGDGPVSFSAVGGRGGGAPAEGATRVTTPLAVGGGGRGGGPAAAGRGGLTRETLANSLGPLDSLVPAGF